MTRWVEARLGIEAESSHPLLLVGDAAEKKERDETSFSSRIRSWVDVKARSNSHSANHGSRSPETTTEPGSSLGCCRPPGGGERRKRRGRVSGLAETARKPREEDARDDAARFETAEKRERREKMRRVSFE